MRLDNSEGRILAEGIQGFTLSRWSGGRVAGRQCEHCVLCGGIRNGQRRASNLALPRVRRVAAACKQRLFSRLGRADCGGDGTRRAGPEPVTVLWRCRLRQPAVQRHAPDRWQCPPVAPEGIPRARHQGCRGIVQHREFARSDNRGRRHRDPDRSRSRPGPQGAYHCHRPRDSRTGPQIQQALFLTAGSVDSRGPADDAATCQNRMFCAANSPGQSRAPRHQIRQGDMNQLLAVAALPGCAPPVTFPGSLGALTGLRHSVPATDYLDANEASNMAPHGSAPLDAR